MDSAPPPPDVPSTAMMGSRFPASVPVGLNQACPFVRCRFDVRLIPMRSNILMTRGRGRPWHDDELT